MQEGTKGLSRRAFLSLSAGVAASSLLAACTVPQSAPATTGGAAPGAEPVQLDFMSYWVDQKGFVDPLVAQAEALTDTEITMDWIEISQMMPKLKSQLAAGVPPDLISLDPADATALGLAGELMPLAEHLDASGGEWRSAINPDILEAMTLDGELYGIGLDLAAMALYYNSAITDEFGLEPAQSVDQMYEWPTVLAQAQVVPLAYGAGDNWYPDKLFFPVAGQTAGAEGVRAAEAGERSWASPEFVQAFQIMLDMRDNGLLPNGVEGLGWQDVKQIYYSGNAASWLFGSWQIDIFRNENALMTENNEDGMVVTAHLFPAVTEGGTGVITANPGGRVSIATGTDAPEAALAVLHNFSTEPGQTVVAESYKIPIAANLDLDAIELEEPYSSLFAFYLDNLDKTVPLSVKYSEIAVALQNAIQGLFVGSVTPEEAAQAVEDASQTVER